MSRKVLIADSQAAVRAALRLLIEQLAGLEVIEEAADSTGLLRVIGGVPGAILLLDWDLPGLPIAQTLRLVRLEQLGFRIICLSGRTEDRLPALAAGADAFVWKGDSPNRLLTLIATADNPTGQDMMNGGTNHER